MILAGLDRSQGGGPSRVISDLIGGGGGGRWRWRRRQAVTKKQRLSTAKKKGTRSNDGCLKDTVTIDGNARGSRAPENLEL